MINLDFETEFSGVETTESPAVETEVTQQAAPEDGAAEQTSIEQGTEAQADIQDGQEEKTVPYDRFSEVNTENKQLKEQINKLLELQLQSTKPQQQQKQEDVDLIEQILGDEEFVTKDKLREILKLQNNLINQNLGNVNQVSKEQILMQHEAVFRQSNPDYDTVIKQIPQKLTVALLQTYGSNPAELIQEAYRLGKAYAPVKKTASEVAAQAKTEKKVVTLNDMKSTGIQKTPEKVSFEEEFRASIGR